ncbi:MAG: hypothetical protein ACO1SV_03350 [Fimbriimonas sp.]
MIQKALLVLGVTVATALAAANDGWVGSGGTPKLMKGHLTVRMLREKVRIHVRRDRVTVDAEFWFRNGGADTTLRVGFPDESTDPTGEPVLKKFRSWVDGRLVKTRFEAGERADGWHVKSVTFPKGRTVHVRDRYEVPIGNGRLGPKNRFVDYVSYTVHTGSSWKGTIGETDIQVWIDPSLPYPRRVLSDDLYQKFTNREVTDKGAADFVRRHRNTVFTRGVAKPWQVGRILVFRRRDWRPTEEDDLFLVLNARRDTRLERQIQGD